MNFDKIYICGDIHGEFELFEKFIYDEKPDIILQCGDFGIWPKFNNLNILSGNKKYKFNLKIPNYTKLFFCDGNHEDHDYLDEINELNENEIFSNIFYMKRGSVLTINNKNILFMGGADSIDKRERTIKLDWFTQEIISQKDIYNLPDVNIEIVISHTCPEYVFDIVNTKFFGRCTKYNDPSRIALDYVFEKYKPKKWYFGHFHQTMQFSFHGCDFYVLNLFDSKGFAITCPL